jgi:hypothetical protein
VTEGNGDEAEIHNAEIGCRQAVRDIWRQMRKLEIIRLVKASHLPLPLTLDRLGIPSTTFYRWYARYRALGVDGLADRMSAPGRVWNRIPDADR